MSTGHEHRRDRPDVELELGPAPLAAVLSVASLVVGLAMVLTVVRSGAPVALVLLFVVAVTGSAATTSPRHSSALARGNGLPEVRDRARWRRLHRSETDRVLLGSVGGSRSDRWIALPLLDGTAPPLLATETPPFPALRRRPEDPADDLRPWVGAGIRGG